MPKNNSKIMIEGTTETGETFRPSDWAERLSGALSTFHNCRIKYSPLLSPSIKNGNKCVVLDQSLKQTHLELYNSILEFAKVNRLKTCTLDTKPSEPNGQS